MTYAVSGQAGIDFTRQVAGTSTDGENAEFVLGTVVHGSDNTRWVYVQAGGAITQYDCVAIDENFQAVAMTHALALAGHQVGFAQTAFDDNDLGWVATSGTNISARLAASCVKDVQLYTSGTAGVLDDTATSTASLIRGVVSIQSATAGVTSREIIANFPSATATP